MSKKTVLLFAMLVAIVLSAWGNNYFPKKKLHKSSNEKTKKKKGLLHYVCMGLIIIFAAYILFGIGIVLIVFSPPIIPHTKTNFKNYEVFREKAYNFYPDTLPASACDISYYSYSSVFDERRGVAFTLEPKDYPAVVSEFMDHYEKIHGDTWKGGKKYVNEDLKDQFEQDENLFFLESLAGDELSGYRIIFYISTGGDEVRHSEGVLGNEKTGRIIAFDVKDAFPKK